MDFTIEELSMNAWPSLQTLIYDGWIIRMSEGYGHRANSVNLIYKSKINLKEKFNYCDGLFTRNNIPTTYKLLDFSEHRSIDEELEKMNYLQINKTSIQVCRIPAMPDRKSDGVSVSSDFDNRWINGVIEFNMIEEKHIGAFKKIIGNIAAEKIIVSKEIDGMVVGCGYGAIENGYAGLFDIVVKENYRGKGYGREIVETILAEARKRGIEKSYLQVMLNNQAALHLYEKLGFKEIYRYWYRKKVTG